MSNNQVPLTVLAAALSACVVESELLNSERIETQFGDYGIEVLSYEDGVRRSSLYSTNVGERTCRTYAVVRFDDVPDSIIGAEHARIVAGSSIGEIFKMNGWEIFKETRYVGELALTNDEHGLHTLMRLGDTRMLAMHVYRLYIKKEEQVIEYATIMESHHPDYLNRQALQELYIVDTPLRLTEAELVNLSTLVLDID